MIDAIPVFYSEELIADADSFSPSSGKPKPAVEAWRAADLPIDWRLIVPATFEELSAAHDPGYVLGILSGLLENGFANCRPEVARSLPFTSGAMLCAARLALSDGIACAPVSGFHHANYASAGGFCTFNGLMVTAARLLAEGQIKRIMILDCDMHYGNGTDEIIARLGLAEIVDNATFGRWFAKPAQAERYLEYLVREVARFHDFDLVLYQAGADVHVDDPLGGVLTTEQMRIRDETVFRAAKAAGVPLAWNLAGGYQEPLSNVLALHTQTMRECVNAYLNRATA
jgi:acetoin utilization deacetylase AcuC-like enzyme